MSAIGAGWRGSWVCLLVLVAIGLGSPACRSRAERQVEAEATASPPDQLPPLEHLPIDPPLRVTATFGEYRTGHFHAGLDFSTEQRVGRPVFAPVTGSVERIRTSGAGFGRSLMIRAPDGRTILFAHLDAFDEPIASFVAGVQESTGRYEQDLTLELERFPVRAGQRVAWTGESGAGPPHLHMEIRWGEMAYNPLRFGLTIDDRTAPVLRRATLEPIDDSSYVAGSAGPRTFALGVGGDTVVVEGRARVWVESIDGITEDWLRVATYAVSMEWNGEKVECRFDRVPWDEEMPAVEWLYDGTARVAPGRAVGLWSTPDYRPSVLTATGSGKAGVIEVRPGDPPRALTVRAQDAAGNAAERRLVLRPHRPGEPRPALATRRRRAAAGDRFELMPVDGPFVRIRYRAAPGARDVSLGIAGATTSLRPATFDGARWVAVVRVPAGASALVATGPGASSPWEDRQPARLTAVSPNTETALVAQDDRGSYRFVLPPGSVFAPTFVVVESLGAAPAPPALRSAGPTFEVLPAGLPLRSAAKVEATAPGITGGRTGLFYQRGSSWRAAGSASDSAATGDRKVSGQARSLGRFAIFEDVTAPQLGVVRTSRIVTPAPNRWSLQCRLIEHGSGLNADRTYFLIDGRRVPSEWDAERGLLRWRPHRAPAAGAHDYVLVAVDRVGNETRRAGRFTVR